jgi:hypothetical protein
MIRLPNLLMYYINYNLWYVVEVARIIDAN